MLPTQPFLQLYAVLTELLLQLLGVTLPNAFFDSGVTVFDLSPVRLDIIDGRLDLAR